MLALALHVPLVACRNRGISSATTTNCCANITHTPCVSCAACMLERRVVRRVMRCVALRCVWHFQVPLIDVPHMRLPVANDTPPPRPFSYRILHPISFSLPFLFLLAPPLCAATSKLLLLSFTASSDCHITYTQSIARVICRCTERNLSC